MGQDLRSLLHGTALAITAFGAEAIPEDELLERLATLEIGNLDYVKTGSHPLTNLMVAFFFKQVIEHSGCEFLHKSLREYLAAEAIVEVLKEYGERTDTSHPEKPSADYWKDFPPDDTRFWLTRKLGEILAGQWLSDEIVKHLEALIEWEVDRAFQGTVAAPSGKIAGIPTRPLAPGGWERVRDGLADLWDWWGEGVHLRPQPKRTVKDWKIDAPPFVFELQQRAMRRDNHNKTSPPRPLRTATVDAHLGYGFFQLTAYIHGFIADAQGWNALVKESSPEQVWMNVANEKPRRYQVRVEHRQQAFVIFAPSGQSNIYFRNYAARINAAGVAPPSFAEVDFPGLTYMHAVCLRRCDLRGMDFDHADLSTATLARTTMVQTSLRGARLPHSNLRRADLILSDFTDADLSFADLHRAYTLGVELSGVHLESARNLVQVQIDRSVSGNRDFLPPHLTPPAHWRKPAPVEIAPLDFGLEPEPASPD